MANTGDKKTGKASAAKNSITRKSPVAASLPSADQLKARFKAGSVPSESDFKDLIDTANIGRLAVGNGGPGWGLTLDSAGKLHWDFSKIFYLHYDLSPVEDNEHVILNNEYTTGTDDNNHQLALLTLNPAVGPTEAVNSKTGETTIFKLPAVKTTASGERSHITVNIVASKKVGETEPLLPFEYIDTSTVKNTLWYCFNLDTSSEDFSNCTLVIDPLTIIIRRIKDFAADHDGEIVSMINFSFAYTDSRQMLPKGIISMFQGSKVPAGWAICDGANGTPDLRDKFILSGALSEIGEHNNKQIDKSGGSYTLSQQSESTSMNISVTVAGHALTEDEMPEHRHKQGDTYIHNFDFEFGAWYPTGDRTYISGGGTDGSDDKRYAPFSGYTGSSQAHSHSAGVDKSSTSHKHTVDIMPPYYVLAFIMKL